jgi:hypothetical protein
MASENWLYRGKTLDAQNFIKYTDASIGPSSWTSSFWIDTSGLHHLSLHVHINQSVSFSSGALVLKGSNIDSGSGTGAVEIVPVTKAGDGTLSGASLALPAGGSGDTILTYTNLPRWVRPVLFLNDTPSMVGELSVHLFGWMV